MVSLFNTFLYQPLFNALVFIYNTIAFSDIGLAIIFLTILIRLLLLPFSIKMTHSQKMLQNLQPKIEALKIQHKDDKEALSKEMMKLYREEHVNPFSSCLPLLIQLPFFFAIYQVFIDGLKKYQEVSESLLYSFVQNPGTIEPIAFGFLNLGERNIPLALAAGAAQYFQMKMLSQKKSPKNVETGAKDEDTLAAMNRNMQYTMPIVTVVIGISFPGGLTLYWLITTIFSILQQWIQFRPKEESPSQQ